MLEKTCVALVWAIRKLRHYMLSFQVFLIAQMDPLKYLMEKPVQDGKTAKWVLLPSEFDIKYVTQKSIKGQAIADHLANCLPTQAEEVQDEFPDEDILMLEPTRWRLYFDGAANRNGSGVGVLLISPKETHVPVSIKLNFSMTNNVAEYEACLLGLETAISMGIEELDVYGDSALIIQQMQNKWKIKEEKLLPYFEYFQDLAKKFIKIEYHYIPRTQNQFANALATLASMIDIPNDTLVQPLIIK